MSKDKHSCIFLSQTGALAYFTLLKIFQKPSVQSGCELKAKRSLNLNQSLKELVH